MDATEASFLSNLRSGDKLLRDFLSISNPDPLYPYLRPRVWRAETTSTEKERKRRRREKNFDGEWRRERPIRKLVAEAGGGGDG